ncbi:MAG: amidase family protein [Litorivicinus sp.]
MNHAPWMPRFSADPTDIYTQMFKLDGSAIGPLSGLRVAIKDLYDVLGQQTLASQYTRRFEAPAKQHALAVQQLLNAGVQLVGHTVSTQLAYSGVGQNPEFGESRSLWSPDMEPRLAGGSTRGGALAVAAGLAELALGTDTGGSCRIPAACNGLYGVKYSAAAVSLKGCRALSPSLDSAGLMAGQWDHLVAGSEALLGVSVPVSSGPQTFVVPAHAMVDLDPTVEWQFNWLVDRLTQAGHQVVRQPQPFETQLAMLLQAPSIVVAEAFAGYRRGEMMGVSDQLVLVRLRAGSGISREGLGLAYRLRDELIEAYTCDLQQAWVLMPTLRCLPPKLSEVALPEGFTQWNQALLRNPSLINLADGCAVSLPLSNWFPVSASIASFSGNDANLLALAGAVNQLIVEQTG